MDLTTLPGYVPGLPDTLGLRDLGGQISSDGRRVRKGLLYRGSAFVNLTSEQQGRISELGIRHILDLRARGEAEEAPEFVPEGAERVRIGGMYDAQGEEVDFSPSGIERISDEFQDSGIEFIHRLYTQMMFDNPAVRTLVEWLRDGEVPLFFHCSAGKDRTGVCAATLLTILGVPDRAILDEFLLTNTYRAEIINMTPDEMPPYIPENDRKNWAQINSVIERNLADALAAADERYGSREAWIEAEFDLSPTTVATIRNRYLE